MRPAMRMRTGEKMRATDSGYGEAARPVRPMRLEQPAREAAVDGNHGPGEVRRSIRGEEADDFADLARTTEPPERNRLEVVSPGAIDVGLGEARCVDSARRDRVDGHPVGADLAGERLRPADHSGPHRVR